MGELKMKLVFESLKEILVPYAEELDLIVDDVDNFISTRIF